MSIVSLSPPWTLAADATGWFVVHLGISYLCFKLPGDWFAPAVGTLGSVSTAQAKTREQRFYERVLRIKRWKDRLPEGGSLFRGGFSKKRLAASDTDYLRLFLVETRRGEWTHWLSIVPAPLFFIWNEPLYGWMMMLYALIANLPFILILRYNRLRLLRMRHLFIRGE